MKTKRNLSGVYFRSKNEETGKFDNVVFEDLTEKEQDDYLLMKDKTWVKGLCKILANTINEIGDEFEIAKE